MPKDASTVPPFYLLDGTASVSLEEPRTTDSLRPGRMGKFLARWYPARAAFALLMPRRPPEIDHLCSN